MPKGNLIPLEEIDPLTFIAMFNRQNTLTNRVTFCEKAKNFFDLTSPVPSDFNGIPTFNNQKTWFFNYKYSRNEHIIDDLWVFANQINNSIGFIASLYVFIYFILKFDFKFIANFI